MGDLSGWWRGVNVGESKKNSRRSVVCGWFAVTLGTDEEVKKAKNKKNTPKRTGY